MKQAQEAEEDTLFYALKKEIEAAEGRAIVGWMAKIETAANNGDWKAAAWKAERRYPNDYSRQVRDFNVKSESTVIIETGMDVDDL